MAEQQEIWQPCKAVSGDIDCEGPAASATWVLRDDDILASNGICNDSTRLGLSGREFDNPADLQDDSIETDGST